MSIRGFPFIKQFGYSSDPFLCHKNVEEEQYFRESPILDNSNDIFLFDQYCPSSGPSSPSSTYSSSQSSNLYSFSQASSIKQEPQSFFDQGNSCGLSFPCSLPSLDDLSDGLCEIPVDYFEPSSGNQQYQDFIDLYGVEISSGHIFDSLPATDLLMDAMMENVANSIDPVSSIPAPLKVDMQALTRPVPKNKLRNGKVKRVSPPTQAPIISPVSSYSSLDNVQQWKQNSANFSKLDISGSSRSSSLTSGDGSSSKSSKRPRNADGKRSPTAYADRRKKNNIAVRKSREKKRQEINRFTEEHMHLQRQCELLKATNEKLLKTLDEVQGALVEDSSGAPVRAIIASAKKQLNLH